MNAKTHLEHKIPPRRQRGMTLIELAVVLTILVALSTLLIPYVSSYIGQAESTTSNYNATAALNAMQQFNARYGRFPDNLDLLSTNGAVGEVAPYLDSTVPEGMLSGGVGLGGVRSVNFGTMQDITASMAASLLKVGIRYAARMKAGTFVPEGSGGGGSSCWTTGTTCTNGAFDATYGSQETDPNNSGRPLLHELINFPAAMWVSDSCHGYWMQGRNECVANMLGYYSENIDYALGGAHMLIMLGINQNNEMIGKTISQAPVHFPDSAKVNPSLVYSRFLAVFDVDMKANCYSAGPPVVNNCAPAKLVGVVSAPDAKKGWQTATTGYARAFSAMQQ